MLKRMKIILIAVVMFLVNFSCLATIGFSQKVQAEELTPTISIYAKNLTFTETVYIKYAVKVTNVSETDELGLLVWTEAPQEYTYGTHNAKLSATYEDVNGTSMPTFTYDRLAAKQMTDVLYTVAYVERNGEYYYSAPKKYSILEYAYNKLGKTNAEPTTNTELKELLQSMLIYGGNAQKYFDYAEDRLASDEHYYIEIENGTLADGFNYGLFTSNQQVVVTAKDKEGTEFSYWTDENGNILSTDKVYTHTPSKNVQLMAVYDDEIPDDEPIFNNLLSVNYEKTQGTTVATLSLGGNVNVCGFEAVISYEAKGAQYASVSACKVEGIDTVECTVQSDGSIKIFFYQSQLEDLTSAFDIVTITFNNTEATVELNFTIDVSVFVDSAFEPMEYTIGNTTFEG